MSSVLQQDKPPLAASCGSPGPCRGMGLQAVSRYLGTQPAPTALDAAVRCAQQQAHHLLRLVAVGPQPPRYATPIGAQARATL